MRHAPTRAEEVLWRALRGRRLAGLKFRRQHAIGQFIVDFCCSEKHLVVEVDGKIHTQNGAYDEARDEVLTARGFRVLRFTNDEALYSMDRVLSEIAAQAAKK
jgi:5-methyltetrahydrofolate--homocysteine methyltransferase